MKRIVLCFSLQFLCMAFYAQNILPNPSFESFTGSIPATFNSGQVNSWFGIGADTYIKIEDRCPFAGSPTFNASDGQIFAYVGSTDKAIATTLIEPVTSNQKLTVSFDYLFPTCQVGTFYQLVFYLSNVPPQNSGTNFPVHPPASQYLRIGKVDLHLTFNNWLPVQPVTFVVPEMHILNGAVPCNFKYLYMVVPSIWVPGAAESSGSMVPPPVLYFDNFQVAPCQSNITGDFAFSADYEGTCTNVKFSALPSSGIGQNHYSWDFGDGSCTYGGAEEVTFHTYSAMGQYTVRLKIIDSNGCITEVTKTILVRCTRCRGINAEFAIVGCDGCIPLVENNPKTGQNEIIGYSCDYLVQDFSTPSPWSIITEWIWNGVHYSNYLNPFHVQISAGIGESQMICLEIHDSGGCYDYDCQQITFPCGEEKPSGLNNAPANKSNLINVSPNPTNGKTSISIFPGFVTDSYLNVYDMQGRLRQQLLIYPGETEKTIDMSGEENGVYIFSIISTTSRENKRVVVNH